MKLVKLFDPSLEVVAEVELPEGDLPPDFLIHNGTAYVSRFRGENYRQATGWPVRQLVDGTLRAAPLPVRAVYGYVPTEREGTADVVQP